MLTVIFASLLPLIIKANIPLLYRLDKLTLMIFCVDYLIQTARNYHYCGTLLGIIDFLSLMPALPWFRVLKLVRVSKTIRAFKLLRFWEDSLLYRVLKKQKTALLLVWSLAVVYVFVIALVMFNAEPDIFENFLAAVYWSCMTLTTVGYGDIVPITVIGRVITMISSFIGMALVALPSGIIAAGYMAELGKDH